MKFLEKDNFYKDRKIDFILLLDTMWATRV